MVLVPILVLASVMMKPKLCRTGCARKQHDGRLEADLNGSFAGTFPGCVGWCAEPSAACMV